MSAQASGFKRLALIGLGLTTAVAVLLWLAGENITGAVKQQLTSDMFVAKDGDAFDPGLPIGARFPSFSARLNAMPVTDVSRLVGDKGMIFIAVRSVDW
jgi:hypothetical protein